MPIALTLFGAINSDPGTFDGAVGIPMLAGVYVVGGAPPYNVSASALPAGVILNPLSVVDQTNPAAWATFLIEGTPTTPGPVPMVITVTDSALATGSIATHINISATKAYEMGLPPGFQGLPVAFAFNDAYADSVFTYVNGHPGVHPYAYGPLLWAGQDPGGMSISLGGLFSGSPVAPLLISPFDIESFEASIGITDAAAVNLSVDLPFVVFRLAPPPVPTLIDVQIIFRGVKRSPAGSTCEPLSEIQGASHVQKAV